MDKMIIASQLIGTSIGAIQTPLMRENVDRKYPKSSISSAKGYGYPSALGGMILGGAALIIAGFGSMENKEATAKARLADSKAAPVARLNDIVVSGLIGYGTVALETGLFSGIYPAVTEADCIKAGGVWNATDHTCKKPATTTTGMYPSQSQPPQIQYSGVDMNTFRQMSSELQRLSQENSNLRTRVNQPSTSTYPSSEIQRLSQELANVKAQLNQPMPGPTVYSRQQRYGFMEPEPIPSGGRLAPETLQPAPGQPTRRAKQYGFMEEASYPTAKVQQMKARFDFSG